MKKVFDEIPYICGKNIIIKQITQDDAQSLAEMTADKDVYEHLPTFLFEQKYKDVNYVIKQMYDECFAQKESVLLGIYQKSDMNFCGIAELYDFKDHIHKVSIGCRLMKQYWGSGIAAETAELLVDYLYSQTDTEIIAASTMSENRAAARVMEKLGFSLVVSESDEDWGYEKPIKTDKWIR